ncbi:MAG: hypothetical protein KatS3mg031_0130 [Chitinophagales bacterium]|nr:MAG: hypothetical protein KatS3mg031_0130 [Chitinophagales bacterium]
METNNNREKVPEELPPLLSWTALYGFVIGFLIVQIIFFSILTSQLK